MPSHLALWKLFFLRWVPEACIPGGGPVTAYHKLSQLVDEIEILQSQLRQYKGPSPGNTPLPSPSRPPSDQRRMYFTAISFNDSPTPPDFLTSSFPYSPAGNLCRPGILGTPISKFLNGARTWLSTETLDNDTVWGWGCSSWKFQLVLRYLCLKYQQQKRALDSWVCFNYKLKFAPLMLSWKSIEFSEPKCHLKTGIIIFPTQSGLTEP